jgi:hypothetical protein
MKTKLLNLITAAFLLLFPIFSFGQATVRPTMGTTENFVLFTTNGALTNTGASQLTLLTGDVGSNTAAITTNLGNIDGSIYATGDGGGVTAQAAADLVVLYNELFGLAQDYALATLLGGPTPFPPGVYANAAVTSLDGNLILDAENDPNALFIFVIKAPGTFSTTANSSIELINGAQACNVFWLVEGTVSIATGNTMKGTIVSAAAIDFAAETEFEGRALTKVGAITINNNEIGFLAQKPIGCDSPTLVGPTAPDLATAGCFALFTGNGSMGNNGVSTIVGDVGSNTAPPSGFELPTTVDGTVHAIPNAETIQADLDLVNAYDYLVAIPNDIELLAPALFGYNLILTPHTYVLAAETHLTGDLYLDAQGNPDAVFVIKVDAAFFTAIDSRVLLINDAQAKNVYWKVTGAVSIEVGTFFEGTIIATGAVDLKSGADINGRALTTTGNFSTDAVTVLSPGCATASAPEITTQPTNQEVCEGGSVSFIIEATGTDLTYQWRKGTANLVNGTTISGVTTATLTIDPVATTDAATDYNVVVTGSVDPFTATSNNVSLTVNSAPEITAQPENQSGCLGSSVSFTATATGADLTYQWRKGVVDLIDGAAVSGATSATLTIDPVAITDAGTDYNVVISGLCGSPITSNNVSLEVNSAPEITVEPTSQDECIGGSVSFSVTATGTDLTYQWRKGEVDLENIVDHIDGVSTATLTIDPISIDDAANNYNVVVSGACAPAVTSANASLVVSAPPAITFQPTNQVACEGGEASFTVVATGDNITYQWRKGTTNLVNGATISGVTTATLTIDPVAVTDVADSYNVIITGVCGTPATSTNASLEISSSIELITQPTNQTECEGGSASFTVEATGAGLTYQWRKGVVDLIDGAAVSGATSATLTIDPVAITDAGTDYNVVISGTCSSDITSNSVSLTVNTAPVITLHPTNQNGCAGGMVSFTVEATGSELTYQWRKALVNLTNTGNILGATSATLTIDPVDVSDVAPDYDVVVTGVCAPSAASNNASLSVNLPPEITYQPVDQNAYQGGIASFSVTAEGSNLTYQWRRGTTNLTNSGSISGATSETITIDPVEHSDAATDYNVVVSGDCEPAVTSVNVSLYVISTSIDANSLMNTLSIYPNPFSSSVNIKLNDAVLNNEYELMVYNILGVLMVKTTIIDQVTTINTEHYFAGIYFYRVMLNNKIIQSGKLIKQE